MASAAIKVKTYLPVVSCFSVLLYLFWGSVAVALPLLPVPAYFCSFDGRGACQLPLRLVYDALYIRGLGQVARSGTYARKVCVGCFQLVQFGV